MAALLSLSSASPLLASGHGHFGEDALDRFDIANMMNDLKSQGDTTAVEVPVEVKAKPFDVKVYPGNPTIRTSTGKRMRVEFEEGQRAIPDRWERIREFKRLDRSLSELKKQAGVKEEAAPNVPTTTAPAGSYSWSPIWTQDSGVAIQPEWLWCRR